MNTQNKCPTCGHKMTALFYSLSCDRCSNITSGWFYHGYILWTTFEDSLWEVQRHPIFKNSEDVYTWMDKQYSLTSFEIRDVLSYKPFIWNKMYATNLDVADFYYKVSKDPFFELDAEKYTVIIMPAQIVLPEQETLLMDKNTRASLGLNW
jgi:hypothetical protein